MAVTFDRRGCEQNLGLLLKPFIFREDYQIKLLDATQRWRLRQERAKPMADKLHA